ncbi:hypothetical protein [Chitiniphilus eburneus]|uniref:hypothetical protein n=1 Tax=Chitiniphilus eburneus TaxID=2571148 RepID=UPI0035CED15C
MNRTERRAQSQPTMRLSPQMVFQCLVTPRAALDRLAATGRIDSDDLGTLQCVVKVSEMLAERLGRRAPDTVPMRILLNQSDAGEAVDLEQIEHARRVLREQITPLYRATTKAQLQDVHKTIMISLELAPAGAWEG